MSKKGPFGLWMGMTTQDVGAVLEEISPGKYRTTSVPIPHSAFDGYVLQITPQCGLSWIKAIGKTIQTSVYGLEIKSAFERMEGKLAATYGRPHRTDDLLPGSIWNEPREWTQGLLLRERRLMAQWAPEHGASLGDTLTLVLLAVRMYDMTSGGLCVEYYFANSSASDDELAAQEDQAL